MGLFHNSYEGAGAGIAKDEPKKKPFFRFWEIVWRKLGKLVGVNLVYTLFLLPGLIGIISLFTMKSEKLSYLMAGFCLLVQAILIGPSMAGMTKVLRNFSQERHAYVWYDYITALKRNFKQSVVVGVFDSVMLVCVACGVYVYPQLISIMNNNLIYVPFVLMFTVALTVLMMNYYAFLMIVSTDLSLRAIVKNSFALTCIALKKNILTVVLSALVIVVFAFLCYVNFYFLFLLPFLPMSFLWLMVCFNCYPVIQKLVINPYYEQRGEENPELRYTSPSNPEESICVDQGGKEKPIEPKKKPKRGKTIS